MRLSLLAAQKDLNYFIHVGRTDVAWVGLCLLSPYACAYVYCLV